MATAAIKAVELDDHLGGTPVQYREVVFFRKFFIKLSSLFKKYIKKVQLHESKLFLSYFENIGGIR